MNTREIKSSRRPLIGRTIRAFSEKGEASLRKKRNLGRKNSDLVLKGSYFIARRGLLLSRLSCELL